LLPISVLYWLVMTVRNWLFDKHVLPVTKLNVPVLSVGNIAAGGTGKTPLVEIVVRKLQARGRKPAIVSRGYGRITRGYLLVSGEGTKIASPRDAGDEAVQMAENCAGSVVAVGENRVEAVKRVLSESSADCIVVDDGFQHRYLHRDLNIVLMTAKELIGGDWMLPAGNRRESMISIRRADAVIISTNCRQTLRAPLRHFAWYRARCGTFPPGSASIAIRQEGWRSRHARVSVIRIPSPGQSKNLDALL